MERNEAEMQIDVVRENVTLLVSIRRDFLGRGH